MKISLSLSVGMLGLAIGTLAGFACENENEDENEAQEEDERAECMAAMEAIECASPLEFMSIEPADRGDGEFVDGEGLIVQLSGGVYIPAAPADRYVGDAVVDNGQCLIGCFVHLPPDRALCVATNFTGSVDCDYSGSQDESSCQDSIYGCGGW